MVDRLVKDTILSLEEGPECEFKDITNAKDKVKSILNDVDRYVVGYLNKGVEGSIYWGISDGGKVHGVYLKRDERDAIRKKVPEKLRTIQPTTTPTEYQEPFFTSVYREKNDKLPISGLYIVKVVAPAAFCLDGLHYTADGKAYLRSGTSCPKLNAREVESELTKRIREANQMENLKPAPEHPTPTPISKSVNVLPNPYDIAATARNDIFKGRDYEINELLDAIANGTHTAIFGLQRMGKTSLIEETLMDRIEQHDDLKDTTLFVNVDFQGFGSRNPTIKAVLDIIVTNIAAKISPTRARRVEEEIRNKVYNVKLGEKDEMLMVFKVILGKTINALRAKRVVLFLDEFSELCQAIEKSEEMSRKNPGRDANIHVHEIGVDVDLMHWFSALFKSREIKEKLVCILAVRPFVAEYDRAKNLQLHKLMNSITLYHLNEHAAKALMTDPLKDNIGYAEGCVDDLYELTAGHPYLIQLFLLNIINRIRSEGRCIIEKDDILNYENKIISEGPGQQAHFDVLDSDYSIDAVTNPECARMGKRILGLMAKLGREEEDGWVEVEKIIEREAPADNEKQQIYALLAQLRDAKIIIERKTASEKLEFRIAIPLLQKRYIKQNMYERYS